MTLRRDGRLVLAIAAATMMLVLLAPATALAGSKIDAGWTSTFGILPDGSVLGAGRFKNSASTWTSITAMSVGEYAIYGVRDDGTVVTASGSPLVSTWTSITAIAAEQGVALGLKADGTVVSTAAHPASSWTNIKQIRSGQWHTVGLKHDGTVVASKDPAKIGYGYCDVYDWRNVKAVAAGDNYTVGLKTNGTVLYAGSSAAQSQVKYWTGIVAIAAGEQHIVGLKSDGSLVAAGSNRDGQCNVTGLRGAIAVAAGLGHTVVLKSNGQAVAVGSNWQGERMVGSWFLPQSPVDMTAATIDGIAARYVNTGASITPTPTVTLGAKVLTAGLDYAVAYSNNVEVGTATVEVRGKGAYTGTITRTFEIVVPIDTAEVTGVEAEYAYTGMPISPQPVLTVDGSELTSGTDYEVTYLRNLLPGYAAVQITGIGAYGGTTLRPFTITGPLAVASVKLAASYTYKGAAIEPSPTVTTDVVLRRDIDYTVEYADNAYPGVATMILTGQPPYQGTLTTTFTIAPGLDASTRSIKLGTTTKLNYCGGSGTVTWSSSNRAIATVSSTGVVKGTGLGTATIYATRNGQRRACKVTVQKANYKLSLSRTVSSGKGYIAVTAKRYNGSALAYRSVKFYRDGTYIGTAKTNAKGRAVIRVAKNREDLTYKASIGGDSLHVSTTAEKPLAFVTFLYGARASGMVEGLVPLGAGNYRVYVFGDGYLWAAFEDIEFEGESGTWVDITISEGDVFYMAGISSDGGAVILEVYRLL